MTASDDPWPNGTPERAVADAFSAFRDRDAGSLVAASTAASVRAGSFLPDELTRLPATFTDSVRCLIVGRVLDARLVDGDPDGRGLIEFTCRVAGAGDDWLSARSARRIDRDIADSAAGLAHVAFRVAYEFPGQGIVPFPPELQIASTQLVAGEWKLELDDSSDVGLPGFRGVGFWIDEDSTTDAATDD